MNETNNPGFLEIFLSQLPIFLIFLVVYYFFIRPNSKKQEEVKNLQSNLQKGDKVITIGGIHGKIIEVKDKTAVLKISNDSELTIEKTAINQKIS